MKARIVAKLLLVLSMGSLFGAISWSTHEKWHRLGRAAYLDNQSKWFDAKMAGPTSALQPIVFWILVVLVTFIFYEGAALLIAKLASIFLGSGEARQPIP
jgi:hypothetical protein